MTAPGKRLAEKLAKRGIEKTKRKVKRRLDYEAAFDGRCPMCVETGECPA